MKKMSDEKVDEPMIHDRPKSIHEVSRREKMLKLFRESPLPDDEILSNLGLYITKVDFSRILYIEEIYKKILNVHGIIIEFGVRWGQNLALFEAFRGIYEPFNVNRKIVGFDTFEGFPSVSKMDGTSKLCSLGAFTVTPKYEQYLERLMDLREQEGVASEQRRFELIKGDAGEQIIKYLARHPETIISLAYFDMDLYEPTQKCLTAIQDNITKGTILAFDELNYSHFPGETLAVKKVLGLRHCRLVHTPFSSARAYLVIE